MSHPLPRLDLDWVRRAQRLIGAKPTGSFDPESVRKLRLWQASMNLPPTGVLDHTTWSLLCDQLEAQATPVPSPPQAGRREPPTTTSTPE